MAIPAIAGRALFLGGGLVGNVIGGALSGAGKAIGGIAEGAGRAVQGAGSAIGGALQGALTPAPKVVINNVGMAGAAGAKKISGRGTLPAPKKVAKPSVNANMPTEKLLEVAVKYLVSIDKTLQEQIKFEALAQQQRVQAEREAAIESKGPSVFERLGEKFGAFNVREYGAGVKDRAGLLTKALIGGLGLAGLATLGISQLDTAELDRLKNNWEAFKDKFGWLGEIASLAANTTSVFGFLIGGWKGAIIGTVVNWLSEKLTGQGFASFLFGGDPLSPNATSTAAGGGMSGGAGDTLLTAGLAGYAGFRGVRTYRDVRARMTRMAEIRNAPRVDPSLKGSGFRYAKGAIDPTTGKKIGGQAASREAVAKSGSWLSGPKGQRFVAFLQKRFSKSWFSKVIRLLGRVFAGVALSATVVGAIPGILWTLLNIGLSLYTVYELLDAWWDFQDEEEAREDAEAVNSSPPETQDATQVAAPALASNRVVSRSETGRPEEAQAFFESKGWTPAQAAGIVGNLVVESGLRTDAVGDGGRAYGIAQWHPDRQAKFQQVYGKDIRNSSFQEQLDFVNWELNNSEKRAGDKLRGASDAATAASIVDQYYERSAGIHRQERMANAAAIAGGDFANLQGGGAGGSGAGSAAGMIGSAFDIGRGAIQGIGNIISTGMGTYQTRSISGAMSPNKPQEISSMSSAIQSSIDFGKDKSKSSAPGVSDLVAASKRSIQNASPDGRLAAIDPNYPGTGGIEAYLQYYKLAA